MSRTIKHTLNGKFKNGLITVKEIPMFMLHFWNRQNFWTGHDKGKRKELLEKESLEVDLKEVDEAMIYV